MNRYCTLLVVVLLVCSCTLCAQNANPLSADVKAAYNTIKGNLTKMADKMSEENYSFKPVPEIRDFGKMVAHVADANAGLCSLAAGGERKSVNAASKTTKADLVAALKASFDICDPVYEGLTDANATTPAKMRNREMTKLGLLNYNVTHDNEEYGYMAVYLRLKGVVPPTSEK